MQALKPQQAPSKQSRDPGSPVNRAHINSPYKLYLEEKTAKC